MKRIFCLIAAIILCFTFFGCSEEKETTDASATFTAAKEKTDALSSFDATMVMSVKYDKESTGTESESTTKLDRRDPEAPVFYKEYNINDLALGQEYTTSMYYADNVVYEMSGMGEKYKTQVAVESIESSFSSVAIDLPAEIFEESTVNGNLVSAKADASKLSEFLEGFTAGASTYYSSLNEDGSFDFDFSDVDVAFTTDDNGYFGYISIGCTAEFEHADGDGKVTVSMTITYNDPGKDVEVTVPDDLSEYTWYESSDKTQEELEGEMMEEILALFDFEDGKATRVENFDELYLIACSKYGKDSVDMYVDTIEMLGGMTE